LKVVWIEANPEVYKDLLRSIEPYSDQKALNALITDRNDVTYTFHISSNKGLSSSIYELHHHKDIWPAVHYVSEVVLKSVTLKMALADAAIDLRGYEVLVMDTQGSELLVLKGAEDILPYFKYIKTEAADFEIYTGCCQGEQISAFLEPRGFRLIGKYEFARRGSGGTCFELLFARDT
jgi:FkbM family methyltransferase